MAEETTQVIEQQETQQQTVQQSSFNPFDETTWNETPAAPPAQQAADDKGGEQKQEPPAGEQAPEVKQPDYNAYIKEKFGFDSEEVLSQELAKLKEQKPQFDFANEDSRKLFEAIKSGKKDEVYSLLEREMKLSRLSTAPIDNANVASEVIKESLRSKYSDLSDDEIHRKFEKLFPIPEKPKQGIDELDDEYQERLTMWERQKSEAEKDMMIEAKIVRKELESLKSELKLPDFSDAAQAAPTQEDLQRMEAVRKAYESELDKAAKSFSGFNVTAKSEDADLPIAFVPTESEKAAYREKLFDFDAENYLETRWLKEDGTVDAQKAMTDLYLLENREAIFQKIANEAAAKMLEHVIKTRSNIKIDSGGRQVAPDLNNQEDWNKKQAEAIWAA